MKRRFLFVISLGVLSSCGGASSQSTAVPSPTLSSIQSVILTPTCASFGCHASANPQGGLVLEAGSSFNNLVGRQSTSVFGGFRVLPGDATSSVLIKRLEGTVPPQMPQDRLALTTAQIDAIREWIRNGALDN